MHILLFFKSDAYCGMYEERFSYKMEWMGLTLSTLCSTWVTQEIYKMKFDGPKGGRHGKRKKSTRSETPRRLGCKGRRQ